jgi:hypothetical protein
MTNHIPNDLSHLSEEEFNSLCPQGEHAPGPEPLTPAAQAVLDAYEAVDCDPFLGNPPEAALAAALRALAARINGADAIRQDILDIADELEGHA